MVHTCTSSPSNNKHHGSRNLAVATGGLSRIMYIEIRDLNGRGGKYFRHSEQTMACTYLHLSKNIYRTCCTTGSMLILWRIIYAQFCFQVVLCRFYSIIPSNLAWGSSVKNYKHVHVQLETRFHRTASGQETMVLPAALFASHPSGFLHREMKLAELGVAKTSRCVLGEQPKGRSGYITGTVAQDFPPCIIIIHMLKFPQSSV